MTKQFLTFALEDELYAVDVLSIREVLTYRKPTRVPKATDAMVGVINLRGGVVPVIDLRRQFGLNDGSEIPEGAAVVIIEVYHDGELATIGGLVDAVDKVLQIDSSAVAPPPTVGVRINANFVEGMISRDDDFIMVLDVNRVFSPRELNVIESTTAMDEVV